MAVPENESLLNQEALQWLKEAKEPAEPHGLHLLTLALWGLENEARGEWSDHHQAAVDLQVGFLCGWTPKEVLDWVLSAPA